MEQYFQCLRQSPLFAPIRPSTRLFEPLEKLPEITEINNLLKITQIKFVPQAPKSCVFEDGYEPRIFLRGEVQTRERNWHDFFNALVWHRFPKTKRIINRLHYDLQKNKYPNKQRGPAENMLTIFDEHGVIAISANSTLLDLIRQRRWRELFWERREQTRAELSFIIFGHGLYEKSLKPYIGLSAHSLLIHHADLGLVDDLAMQFFLSKTVNLSTKDLVPIPILGYPGWWPHQDENFYTNNQYYRP